MGGGIELFSCPRGQSRTLPLGWEEINGRGRVEKLKKTIAKNAVVRR
jgi:hypothetical protein